MIRRAIIAILFLNFVDLISTLIALNSAVTEELNPLMRAAYNISPLFFCVVKMAMTVLGCLIAWEFKNYRLVKKSIFFILMVYVALIVWHCVMWFLFMRG